MKNIKHLTLAVVSLCAAATAFSSCQREDSLLPKGLDGSKYVYLSAGIDESLATKSGSAVVSSETIDLSEDGLDLFVDAQVSINTANPFAPAPATKASVKTGADIDGKDYFVYMYGDDTNITGITGSINGVSNVEGNRFWSLYNYAGKTKGEKVEWPEADESGEVAYNFVSYIELADNVVLYDTYNHEFSFTGPDNVAGMSDLLVAGTQEKHDHANQWTENDFVHLRYYHALAGVRFKFNLAGVTVNSVTIHNVAKSGRFTVNTTIQNSNSDKFKSFFKWTPGDDNVSYTLSKDYSAAGSTIDGAGNVDTSTVTDAEDGTQTITSVNDDNAILFIVPQSLDGVKLTFNLTKGDKTYEISTQAKNLGTEKWDAGYMYTYTISTDNNGNVGIKVNDVFASNKKTVVIENTKRSTVWLRAAVVGNWCYVKGNSIKIMESWDGNDGTEAASLGISEGWTKGTDGFYYYSSPVSGFDSAPALISEWEQSLNGRTKVIGGVTCQLVVRIAAQAIEKTSDNVWNATSTSSN